MPLRGMYIPHFDLQFWGSYTLIVVPMGVKFITEEGTVPNFTSIGATCYPCKAKNLKIGL